MGEKLRALVLMIKPKTVLFVMTFVCIGVIGVTYFHSDTAVPLRTAVGYIVVPLQSGVNNIGGLGQAFLQKQMDLQDARDTIAEQEQEIEALKSQIEQYQEENAEVKQLRKLFELSQTYQEYGTVGATVVASDTSKWFSRFTIDKGSDDGLAEGMNVIADGGLVGILTQVSGNFSVVTSIIDNSSNISAMSRERNALCVVSGDLELMQEGRIRMSYADVDSGIKEDSIIVTSNISDLYLPGILIGYAKDVTVDANQLTLSGYIEPKVDFSSLKDVLVILTTKQNGEVSK